jgi:hypothetical protein
MLRTMGVLVRMGRWIEAQRAGVRIGRCRHPGGGMGGLARNGRSRIQGGLNGREWFELAVAIPGYLIWWRGE